MDVGRIFQVRQIFHDTGIRKSDLREKPEARTVDFKKSEPQSATYTTDIYIVWTTMVARFALATLNRYLAASHSRYRQVANGSWWLAMAIRPSVRSVTMAALLLQRLQLKE